MVWQGGYGQPAISDRDFNRVQTLMWDLLIEGIIRPGRYGSQESKDAYDAVVGQWIGQGRPAPAPEPSSVNKSMTIIELVDAYWDFAKAYYKAGPDRSDGHLANRRSMQYFKPFMNLTSLDFLRRFFGLCLFPVRWGLQVRSHCLVSCH
jgi:hypothetical protein